MSEQQKKLVHCLAEKGFLRDERDKLRSVLERLMFAFDNDTTTAAQLRKVYAAEISEAEALLHNA